jgi:hypothetical protein
MSNNLAMIWHHLAIGSDYFMVTAKHLIAISKYSTTKTRLTKIFYCTELKCYHLTMTSRSATIVSFGNNNPKMHCEFANLETKCRTKINRTKYEIQFYTLGNAFKRCYGRAAISPDPEPHL